MSTPTTADTTAAAATTPTDGGVHTYAASGGAGTDTENAPDVHSGSVHRPGLAPGVDVRSGPAAMKVGKPKNSSKKK